MAAFGAREWGGAGRDEAERPKIRGSETTDSATHRYSVASTSGGTFYACEQDPTTFYLYMADSASWSNPNLMSMLEFATE